MHECIEAYIIMSTVERYPVTLPFPQHAMEAVSVYSLKLSVKFRSDLTVRAHVWHEHPVGLLQPAEESKS